MPRLMSSDQVQNLFVFFSNRNISEDVSTLTIAGGFRDFNTVLDTYNSTGHVYLKYLINITCVIEIQLCNVQSCHAIEAFKSHIDFNEAVLE